MKKPPNPRQKNVRSESAEDGSGRRRTYARPMLQRYGTVGKLTQTGTRSGSDATRMMGPCL